MQRAGSERQAEALNHQQLSHALTARTLEVLHCLEVFQEIDSTNAYLLARPPPPPGGLALALAEYQTAGRGRRGRAWSMPFGAGVMLSMGWCFAQPPRDLSALTLACGVAARDALLSLGVDDIQLKWPNDLVWQQGKLGGILVEVTNDAEKSCYVVTGIGVNFALDETARSAIQPSWGRGVVDISQASHGRLKSRNQLAAALVNELQEVFANYAGSGFEPYRARWSAADIFAGRTVSATLPEGELVGRGAGVDLDGALLVLTATGTRRITAGEVRLKDEL